MVRRVSIGFLVLTAVGLSVPSTAWACGCAEPGPLRQFVANQLRSAERVFAGRVARRDDQSATLVVDTIWKGDDVREIVVHQGDVVDGFVTINTCTFFFRSGDRYVVFARRDQGRLKVSNCGPTSSWEEASRIVAILDSTAARRPPRKDRAR